MVAIAAPRLKEHERIEKKNASFWRMMVNFEFTPSENPCSAFSLPQISEGLSPFRHHMGTIINWCNANQGFLLVVLTLVYVLATIGLVLLGREQIKNAVILEQSRTRPFVLFDLVIDRGFVFAELRNTGQTSARDVKVTVSPSLGYIGRSEDQIKIPFIQNGVVMLAPGRSIKGLVGHLGEVQRLHPKLIFEGSVTYKDSISKNHTEIFAADLSAYYGILHLGEKDIEDVARHLESIASTLNQLAIGRDKPLIRTINEDQYQQQNRKRIEKVTAEFQARAAKSEKNVTNRPALRFVGSALLFGFTFILLFRTRAAAFFRPVKRKQS